MNTKEAFQWLEDVKQERVNFEPVWQDCAEYAIPSRYTIAKQSTPKVSSRIYDETAIWANTIWASGIYSYLTSHFQKWFALGIKGVEPTDDIRTFLKQAEDKIYDTLNQSNFYLQIYETYLDLGAFGISTLYEEEDVKDIVRFYARPVTEIYPVENERGEVDTVFRVFSMTTRQAYNLWGEKAGKKVVENYNANKYQNKVEFLHLVTPRKSFDPSKADNKNMPFGSYWYEISAKQKIKEGGYPEFPFMTVRFSQTSEGSPYAFSPAMECLPSNKMLNRMSKTIMLAAEKMVNPPLSIPGEGFTLPINVSAGAANYGDTEKMLRGMKIEPLYNTNYQNIPVGLEMENQRREMIKQSFFVDLFLLLAGRTEQKTLGEANMMVEEKMMVLSAVLGRLMNELHKPAIIRTFNILVRNKKLEVPQELQGVEYDIEYISPLAKMQKVSSIKDLEQYLMEIRGMAEMNPEVLDNINWDKWASKMSEIRNIDPTLLNKPEVVKAMREGRAKQAEMQNMLEMAKLGAGAAKDAATAEATANPKQKGGKNGK